MKIIGKVLGRYVWIETNGASILNLPCVYVMRNWWLEKIRNDHNERCWRHCVREYLTKRNGEKPCKEYWRKKSLVPWFHYRSLVIFWIFLSIQRHHIKQDRTVFYTATLWILPKCPLQHANRSTTRQGITQASSTWLNIVFQKALAISVVYIQPKELCMCLSLLWSPILGPNNNFLDLK
jgi:hypothetical protein